MGNDNDEQEVREIADLVHAELVWLASERRCWDEISDAWAANPAAPVFEDVARWSARCYVRSVLLCLMDLNDKHRPLLRSLLEHAATGRSVSLAGLKSQADADRKALRSLVRRVRSLADGVVVFSEEGLIARDQLFRDLGSALDEVCALASRYLIAIGHGPIGRPSRRFYPNGMMRRPWLAPDWRPSLFPARADIERAGEFWPILDFISEHDHSATLLAMDTIIGRLRDRTQWTRASPIRSILIDLELPSSDACVQLVRDQLFSRGMDWRPTPPPIPPPVD